MKDILPSSTETSGAIWHLPFPLSSANLATQIGLAALAIRTAKDNVGPCKIYILHIQGCREAQRGLQL